MVSWQERGHTDVMTDVTSMGIIPATPRHGDGGLSLSSYFDCRHTTYESFGERVGVDAKRTNANSAERGGIVRPPRCFWDRNIVVCPNFSRVEPWGARSTGMCHVVHIIFIFLDGVDLDDDLPVVCTPLPLYATELSCAEKGIRVHVELGGKRADAEYQTRYCRGGDSQKETERSTSASCPSKTQCTDLENTTVYKSWSRLSIRKIQGCTQPHRDVAALNRTDCGKDGRG